MCIRGSDLRWPVRHVHTSFSRQPQLDIRFLPKGLAAGEIAEGRTVRQKHAHVQGGALREMGCKDLLPCQFLLLATAEEMF